jgi:cytochrome c biogenesis protein CcmG/thiol:disulfide interchange protein DsbE
MPSFVRPDVVPPVSEGAPEPTERRPARKRAAVLVVAALVVLAAAGIAAALTTRAASPDELSGRSGAPAPAFSLAALSPPGRTVSSSQLRGQDLVLNFWASWCFPCQQEMPMLQAAAQRLGGKVRFVGIDTNDTRSAALGFLGRVHVSYLILFDPNGQVAARYGLFGLPTTVFVSPSGKVLGRHSGQLDATSLQAALTQAFGPAVAS